MAYEVAAMIDDQYSLGRFTDSEADKTTLFVGDFLKAIFPMGMEIAKENPSRAYQRWIFPLQNTCY